MQEHTPIIDPESAKLRKRVQKIGLALFASGIYLPEIIKVTEMQAVGCRSAVVLGLGAIVAPFIRDIQDTKEFLKSLGNDLTEEDDDDQGDEGDWGGGRWDDPRQPIVPGNGPSGLPVDWTHEVEEYANAHVSQLAG